MTPSGVSRTSTPAAASRSRIASEVAKSRAARAVRRRSSIASTYGPTTSRGSRAVRQQERRLAARPLAHVQPDTVAYRNHEVAHGCDPKCLRRFPPRYFATSAELGVPRAARRRRLGARRTPKPVAWASSVGFCAL